ncbi:MAG: pantetheine-phosphate adenylyltransferase [Sulfurospirillaceae bacterium]|nr:pantetheine-phosphate adenylyltransferase [Sulfurospirillaceae bacterium]
MPHLVAIYPGTFDPITIGHISVIKRARKIFDRVIVGIADSGNKNPMFDIQTRVNMAKDSVKDIENVDVLPFYSLLVKFCKDQNVNTIIRGLRAVSDFEFELQIGYANASMDKNIDTVYLMPNLEHAFISSTVVRDIIRHNGDASHLVPNEVLKYIKKK